MKHSTYLKLLKEHRPTPTVRAMFEKWVRTNDRIRPCYTTGHGKRTKNSDHAVAVRSFLQNLGLTYEHGNDAPRGGRTGEWIKPHGWGRFKPLRDHWSAEQEANQRADELKDQARLRAQAARYAGIVGDHRAVLIAWWNAKEYHPAPPEVLAAKQATGLTWKQVREYCRTNA